MMTPAGVDLTPIPDAFPLLKTLLFDVVLSDILPLSLPAGTLRYAALQCTDTFVWGVLGPAGWQWSSEVDSALRPPRLETLLEARIFGPQAEMLAWCGDSRGVSLTGRFATEGDTPEDLLLAPLDRKSLFAGKMVNLPGTPFRRWITGGGKVTIAPHGSGVCVREYLSACPETGVLRIAMTRFLEVN